MSSQIVMPQLGESVVEGTVVKWFVAPGDVVSAGTLLLEVETDKANAEVPATEAGVVRRLLAKPGDVVAVGTPLVELGGAESAPAPAPAVVAAPPAAPVPVPAAAPAAPAPVIALPVVAVPAPPAIPMMAVPAPPAVPPGPVAAASHPWNTDGVVAGPSTGPAIRLALAQAPAPVAPAAPVAAIGPLGAPTGMKYFTPPATVANPGDTVVKFSRRRGIIAEHMVYSKHVSPHVPCFAEVDMTAVSELRRVNKKRLDAEGIPLTILAFVLKAATMALREFPSMNSVVGNDEIIQRANIHLGVAVETEAGLVVPVIRDADQLSTSRLAKAVQDVANKARDRKITVDDLSGGTFTVSNPGRRGNLFGAAIINQPQVGILRMGEIVRRAVVREIQGEEVICIRSMMYLSLSYDHRIIDGVTGNSFLYRCRELLEAGQFDV